MHSLLRNMPIPSCAQMLLKMSLTLGQVGAKTLCANLTPLMHCLFPWVELTNHVHKSISPCNYAFHSSNIHVFICQFQQIVAKCIVNIQIHSSTENFLLSPSLLIHNFSIHLSPKIHPSSTAVNFFS